jgi:alpha-amylase
MIHMKKVLLVVSLAVLAFSSNAKKVKFSVDMTGVDLVGAGVHITGDFQVVAGLAVDSFNTLTPMIKEGTTDIYSLQVEIPAFQKYEYRFVNGDYSYDSEFVPTASRVKDFMDNRWIYIDSLDAGVTDIGAIMYAGNAPKDKKLIRFVVDAKNVVVDESGLHVGTSASGLDPKANALYSFADNIYEVITYVADGTYQYRYVNGITLAGAEVVTGACVEGLGNRSITVAADTVLSAVCFAACTSCEETTAVQDHTMSSLVSVYPNPSNGAVTLDMRALAIQNFEVSITEISGRTVYTYSNKAMVNTTLDKGIYVVSVKEANGTHKTQKLLIN